MTIKIIIFPSLFILAEYICANLSFGFPWISFAMVHSSNSLGSIIIFYFGTYGLSYLTILFFLFPVIFLLKKNVHFKFFIFVYLFFFISIFSLTAYRVFEISKNYKDSKIIKISLVQLNLPVNQKLETDQLYKKFNLILDIIKENKSEFLIFAENNYPFIMDKKSIKFLQKNIANNTNLIIGSTRIENDEYYNSFFFINNNSYQKFDKKILVPFGEFLPFRFYLKSLENIVGDKDFSRGKDKRNIFHNNDINILPVICYEIVYFWNLINRENFKTNLIVNLTNDSWFGNLSGPYQHFYFSKLRAAEFNKYLIRVSNNGISSAIDNFGNIVNYIELNKFGVKDINIRISNNIKNYIWLHKIIMFIIILIPVLTLTTNFTLSKIRKNDTKQI